MIDRSEVGSWNANAAENPLLLCIKSEAQHNMLCIMYVQPFVNSDNTGLSKRKGAKFRELSSNFPKLVDWLSVHGLANLPGSQWAEILSRGTFLLLKPVRI